MGESEWMQLPNQLQEFKGNIRVFCSMRSLLDEERESAEEIHHIIISSEKNMDLTKFVDEASGSKT